MSNNHKDRESKKNIVRTLESCKPGDLICVDWCDASIGKSSLNGAVIDVPARSWGVYLGLMGARIKQIVLAQNSYRYSNSDCDLDYTAIPVGWVAEVICVQSEHLPKSVVSDLLRSFASNNNQRGTSGLRRRRMFIHRMQRKLSSNGGPY
jgi:hypothetical protein